MECPCFTEVMKLNKMVLPNETNTTTVSKKQSLGDFRQISQSYLVSLQTIRFRTKMVQWFPLGSYNISHGDFAIQLFP